MSLETIEQRAADVRAFMARHRLTLKDVCEKAGLNYLSVKTNLLRHDVSDERMTAIEEAAIQLSEDKKQTA